MLPSNDDLASAHAALAGPVPLPSRRVAASDLPGALAEASLVVLDADCLTTDLVAALHAVPPPGGLVVLTDPGASLGALDGLEPTVLERPVSPRTLRSVIDLALRAGRAATQLGEQRRHAAVQLKHAVARRTAHLAQQTQQARALATALSLAEQRERSRLSYILHDQLKQLLCGMRLPARALRNRLGETPSAPETHALLDDLLEINDEAIALTHRLAEELSPPVLPVDGLDTTLAWLAKHMRESHGLEVDLTTEITGWTSDPDQRLLVLQLVREVLGALQEHSGTQHAAIRLRQHADQLTLDILDAEATSASQPAPRPALPSQGDVDLYAIRRRLDLIGGTLRLQTTPDTGAHVTLSIPTSSSLAAAS